MTCQTCNGTKHIHSQNLPHTVIDCVGCEPCSACSSGSRTQRPSTVPPPIPNAKMELNSKQSASELSGNENPNSFAAPTLGKFADRRQSTFMSGLKTKTWSSSQLGLAVGEVSLSGSSQDNNRVLDAYEEWYVSVVTKQRAELKRGAYTASDQITIGNLLAEDTETERFECFQGFNACAELYLMHMSGKINHEPKPLAVPKGVKTSRQRAISQLTPVGGRFNIQMPKDRTLPHTLDVHIDATTNFITKVNAGTEQDLIEQILNPLFREAKQELIDTILSTYRFFMPPSKLLAYIVAYFSAKRGLQDTLENVTVSAAVPQTRRGTLSSPIQKPGGMERSSVSNPRRASRAGNDFAAFDSTISAFSPSPVKTAEAASSEKSAAPRSLIQIKKRKDEEIKDADAYFSRQIPHIRKTALQFLVRWIKRHYQDFLDNPELMHQVSIFQKKLIEGNMDGFDKDQVFYAESGMIEEAFKTVRLQKGSVELQQKLNLRAAQTVPVPNLQSIMNLSTVTANLSKSKALESRDVIQKELFSIMNEEERFIAKVLSKLRLQHNATPLLKLYNENQLTVMLTVLEHEYFEKVLSGTYLNLLAAGRIERTLAEMDPEFYRAKTISELRDNHHHEMHTIMNYLVWFHSLSSWASTLAIIGTTPQDRADDIKKLIKIAEKCRSINNYNTMAALVAGLLHPAVFQMVNVWDCLKKKHVETLYSMANLVYSSDKDNVLFEKYEEETSAATPPFIPFLGATLKKLQDLYCKLPSFKSADILQSKSTKNRIINVEKFSALHKFVCKMDIWRATSYQVYATQQDQLSRSKGVKPDIANPKQSALSNPTSIAPSEANSVAVSPTLNARRFNVKSPSRADNIDPTTTQIPFSPADFEILLTEKQSKETFPMKKKSLFASVLGSGNRDKPASGFYIASTDLAAVEKRGDLTKLRNCFTILINSVMVRSSDTSTAKISTLHDDMRFTQFYSILWTEEELLAVSRVVVKQDDLAGNIQGYMRGSSSKSASRTTSANHTLDASGAKTKNSKSETAEHSKTEYSALFAVPDNKNQSSTVIEPVRALEKLITDEPRKLSERASSDNALHMTEPGYLGTRSKSNLSVNDLKPRLVPESDLQKISKELGASSEIQLTSAELLI